MLSDFDADETRKAALREGLSMLAYGLLLPFGLLRSRHRPKRRRDLRTLVFVHGLAANRSGFFPLQCYLRWSGFRKQYSFNYRSAGSIEALALRLKREIDANIRGGRIDLIAHSMGGLVARYYLQELGGARRVDHLITLATPHRGTHSAVFVPEALVRQLLPESPLIRQLNSSVPPQKLRVTSLLAGRDVLIQPLDSALCPFGEGRSFDDLGHVELLFSPRVFAAVRSALRRA